jgi:plastocyanin
VDQRVARVLAAPAILGLCLLAALTCAGCGKAGTATVTITGLEFQPSVLTVSAGTTVTWVNNDDTAHTVTSDAAKVSDTSFSISPAPGVFGSQALNPGQTFSYTFHTPGMYPYHCEVQPYMTAKVVVK